MTIEVMDEGTKSIILRVVKYCRFVYLIFAHA
jgi:hypothetical protein